MSFRRTALVLSAAAVFSSTSAFPQVSIPAASAYLGTSRFPPVGLASSETAQVNVVNTATEASGAPAPSCSGTIAFYDAGGTIIGAPTVFNNVGTGQIFSARLPYDSTGASGSRTVIRAEIVLTTAEPAPGASSASLPACVPGSSFEAYDSATGVTHVFFSGAMPQGVIGSIRTLPAIKR